MSDRFGQAYGLTLMSPVIGDVDVDGVAHDVAIRRELRALNAQTESPLVRVSTTHLARWVVIDDAPYEAEPAKVDHLESKYLLFTSNFDGGTSDDATALDNYLELIRTQIPEVVERLYSHCVGFPGTSAEAAFQSYMRRCRIPTTFLFGAYGQATQDQVQRSLSLQRGLGDFALAQQATRPTPEHLKERFLKFATTAGLISPQAPTFGPEVIPPHEAQASAVVRDVVIALTDSAQRPVPRTEHGNAAGVVRAELEVADDLPPEFRYGVFREPRVYPALVRFSNSAGNDESKPDTHGMAIKLFDVPGEKLLDDDRHATTQDFLLIDHPTFFIRNVADYAVFAPRLLNMVRLSQRPWVARLPAPLSQLVQVAYLAATYLITHRYEAKIIAAMRHPAPASPLDTEYWSTTPYRFGPHAVHWSVRPQPINAPPPRIPFDDPELRAPANCLRAALVSHLRQRDAAFDLYAQMQMDQAAMPVEDPTILWDEERFPPRRVATIRIPMQEFDTAARRELTLGLSFDPWHSLPAHQPLGGINRVRRIVYDTLAERRREVNAVVTREPDADWLQSVWDA
jgi:hypothetical protein